MIIEREIAKKLASGFVTGFVTSVGMGVGQEMYKLYQAVDPLYDTRMKVRKAKRKKNFDEIMSQTNLKEQKSYKKTKKRSA